MKVIYEKTILEKLDEVIHEAKTKNRKISHIELNDEEMKEMREVSRCMPLCARPRRPSPSFEYMGVECLPEPSF